MLGRLNLNWSSYPKEDGIYSLVLDCSPASERKVCLPKDWKRCLNGSNISTNWEWSKAGASKQLEEQERTERAQLKTKIGADGEVAPEDQLEDENKEAGEEKERAQQELMKQPA
ncbi:fanconi-associated nuclease 1 [Dorcoceras hygrometricum]|uniref:Fanconi-associated nuclease 1 n=1 Tax=Dorcoceras hygrometricum TaxID=472368 RepID=A0A2Z7D1W8_9LAMI|nr:fanconi-associated nuclease 1 [Dorcoceras hygrometricum]